MTSLRLPFEIHNGREKAQKRRTDTKETKTGAEKLLRKISELVAEKKLFSIIT